MLVQILLPAFVPSAAAKNYSIRGLGPLRSRSQDRRTCKAREKKVDALYVNVPLSGVETAQISEIHLTPLAHVHRPILS